MSKFINCRERLPPANQSVAHDDQVVDCEQRRALAPCVDWARSAQAEAQIENPDPQVRLVANDPWPTHGTAHLQARHMQLARPAPVRHPQAMEFGGSEVAEVLMSAEQGRKSLGEATNISGGGHRASANEGMRQISGAKLIPTHPGR